MTSHRSHRANSTVPYLPVSRMQQGRVQSLQQSYLPACLPASVPASVSVCLPGEATVRAVLWSFNINNRPVTQQYCCVTGPRSFAVSRV
jgi:hypothetical protein